MALLLFKRLDFHHPPLHSGGAVTAGLDKIVRTLLILCDLLFHRQIKLLRHLVTLLGVVDDVKAVGDQRGVVAVELAELFKKGLKHRHLIHGVPRDKVEMSIDTDLGGVQRAQILQADGLDLLAVGAGLIKLKELFGLLAVSATIREYCFIFTSWLQAAVRFYAYEKSTSSAILSEKIDFLLSSETCENRIKKLSNLTGKS